MEAEAQCATAPADAACAEAPTAPLTPLRAADDATEAVDEALVDVSLSEDGGDTPRVGLKPSASAPVMAAAGGQGGAGGGGAGAGAAGAALHALLHVSSHSGSELDALPAPQDPAKFGEKSQRVQTPASAPAAPAAGAGEAVAAEAAALSVAASTLPGVPPALAPPRSSERVALFDLDLTLLDVNTGRLWVEKEFREGKVPFQIYLLSVYWFAKYAAGLGVDSSEVAREAMAIYGGQSSAAMASEVEAFWETECEARVRPGARAALAAHRARGERCVLCTATWQHVAAMARRSLALDGAVCSILHVGEDGCFTGAVSDAYGESKATRTVEWAARENVDLRNCTFYTDSYTDTALMELVGTPVAVCPDSRLAEHARKRGWRTEDWGTAPPSADAKMRYSCAVFGMRCM